MLAVTSSFHSVIDYAIATGMSYSLMSICCVFLKILLQIRNVFKYLLQYVIVILSGLMFQCCTFTSQYLSISFVFIQPTSELFNVVLKIELYIIGIGKYI